MPFKILVLATFMGLFSVTAHASSASPAAKSANSQSHDLVIAVEGMTCTGCEGSIEKKVKQVAGVVEVKADHKAKSVTVKTDGKAKLEDIKAAIVKAGYTPK